MPGSCTFDPTESYSDQNDWYGSFLTPPFKVMVWIILLISYYVNRYYRNLLLLFAEQSGGQITLTGIRLQRYDRFPFVFRLLRLFQGGPQSRAC